MRWLPVLLLLGACAQAPPAPDYQAPLTQPTQRVWLCATGPCWPNLPRTPPPVVYAPPAQPVYGGASAPPADSYYPFPQPVLISTPRGYGTGIIIPAACSYCPVLIDLD